MHEPIIEAERRRLRARIHVVPLPDDVVGRCDFATRDVEVSDALTLVERNCTIAHEFAHMRLGLIETGDAVTDAVIEEACDRWVADLLIPSAMFEYAMSVTDQEQERCEILGVDENILRARIRMENTGGTVLVFPAQRATMKAVASDGSA